MSSTYGTNVKISIFGQSHSEYIGVVIDGLPHGFHMDPDALSAFMTRRAPSENAYSTKRREADKVKIISGMTDDITCGAPLCAVIENTDARGADYKNIFDIPRPAHADFAAQMKFGGAQDVRGGGHFSGRLTAPLCIAGGICKQILQEKGIEIAAHIYAIAQIEDDKIDPANVDMANLLAVADKAFPTLNDTRGGQMQSVITAAGNDGDSVGGVIECVVTGMPAGVGAPMFDGIENKISATVFAVPAVKGIEFGSGFGAAGLTGFENNDEFYYDETGAPGTRTNRHGGILGGISSSMPIVFRAAVKPTPSIAKEQNSISFSRRENTKIRVGGRHDACIVPRAVPCIEAACAIALLDMLV